MLMPEVIDDVSTLVKVDDFYDEGHRLLFSHMQRMHDDGKKLDVTLLQQRLIDAGDYERVGGAAYLAELFSTVSHSAHARYYAKVVEEKSTLRQVIMACSEVLQSAYEPIDKPERVLSDAEQRIFAIRERRSEDKISSVCALAHAATDRIEQRMRGENIEGAVETGFTELDRLTGGLRAAELTILAARPSMGKTALAMNIAENVLRVHQLPVLMVSLEMAGIELVQRLMCSVARVDSKGLRYGQVSNEDYKKLVDAASDISSWKLSIDDAPTRTVSQIAAMARRVKRSNNGLGLIVVDYLQLIEPDNNQDQRQEQVAKIARRLKAMAREVNAPVLCLSQLNRQPEDSREHRPRLHHLRESGAIEQDADLVMFIHRPAYYLSGEAREEVEGVAQLLIEKHRNGPVGEIDLTWLPTYTRFANRAADYHADYDALAEPVF
jgi:replicative DNA helicase